MKNYFNIFKGKQQYNKNSTELEENVNTEISGVLNQKL